MISLGGSVFILLGAEATQHSVRRASSRGQRWTGARGGSPPGLSAGTVLPGDGHWSLSGATQCVDQGGVLTVPPAQPCPRPCSRTARAQAGRPVCCHLPRRPGSCPSHPETPPTLGPGVWDSCNLSRLTPSHTAHLALPRCVHAAAEDQPAAQGAFWGCLFQNTPKSQNTFKQDRPLSVCESNW